jgi:hypothetical protein
MSKAIKVNEDTELFGETFRTLRAASEADDGVEGLAGRKLFSYVERVLRPVAAKFETKPEHWVHGWDEGLSFCFECAEKKVAELLVEEPDGDYCTDGGWGSERGIRRRTARPANHRSTTPLQLTQQNRS